MLVFEERGKPEYPEKKKLATKLNPQMASTPGFGPHLWVASALTTAPPLRRVALFPM